MSRPPEPISGLDDGNSNGGNSIISNTSQIEPSSPKDSKSQINVQSENQGKDIPDMSDILSKSELQNEIQSNGEQPNTTETTSSNQSMLIEKNPNEVRNSDTSNSNNEDQAIEREKAIKIIEPNNERKSEASSENSERPPISFVENNDVSGVSLTEKTEDFLNRMLNEDDDYSSSDDDSVVKIEKDDNSATGESILQSTVEAPLKTTIEAPLLSTIEAPNESNEDSHLTTDEPSVLNLEIVDPDKSNITEEDQSINQSDTKITEDGSKFQTPPPESNGSSPRLEPTQYLDLSNVQALDEEDQHGPMYNYSMPGELHTVIYHAPDSLVCKALALYPLPVLTTEEKTALIDDLSKYVAVCTEKGLVQEAVFVQSVKDSVKQTPAFESKKAQIMLTKENLDYAQAECKETETFWDNQKEIADREYEIALTNLNMREQQALDLLDQEWQGEKKRKKFSKPSPTLLNMRYVTKHMISSRQFEAVGYMGRQIAAREREEALDARDRMSRSYQIADENIKKKFQADREALAVAHTKRIDAIARQRELSMKPVTKRTAKLTEANAKLQASAKPPKVRRRAFQPMPQMDPAVNAPFVSLNIAGTPGQAPRLTVPAVDPIKRKRPKTSIERPQGRGREVQRSPTRLGRRKKPEDDE